MRIAFLTSCSYRVDRNSVLEVRQHASTQVEALCKRLGCDFVTVEEVPSDKDDLTDRISQLAIAQPHALILHYAGWTEDETIIRIAETFECPTMLWATSDVFRDGLSKLVAHVGYMEAASVLRKRRFRHVRHYGGPDDQSEAILSSFLRAAKTIYELRNARCGCIGHGYGAEGILDAVFPEDKLTGLLGVQFERYELDRLFSEYNQVRLDEIAEPFGFPQHLIKNAADNADVADSLRMVYTLQRVAEDNHYSLMSVRCFPEFKQNNVPSPCLAVSALNDAGVPTSCEGDILSGVSGFLLSGLTGQPATLMDVLSRDEEACAMDLFHCGSASTALSDGPDSCSYRTHCKPGNHRPGVTVEFPLKEGPVSFLKLDYVDDKFRLHHYQGMSVKPSSTMRGTYGTVKTLSPVKHVIESLLDYGVGHHQVLSFGDVSQDVRMLSALTGLELIEI